MPKKEGRARALLFGVLFPNMFLYGKVGLTSARQMHLKNPVFSTDFCCLLLKPAPHLFHLCQQRCNYSYPHSRTSSIAAFDANRGIPQHSKPLAIPALTEGGKDAPCFFKSCFSLQKAYEQLNMGEVTRNFKPAKDSCYHQ